MATVTEVINRRNPAYVPGGDEPEMLPPETMEREVAAPKPHNQNNPYFGKKPKSVGDFWGLIYLVYIAMANGDPNAGADRYARLTSSRRALGIVRVINGQNLIDVDDVDGHFLQFLGLLLATDHEDGSGRLMSAQERDAIMAAWV